ncbi:hypothetical protein ACGFNU_38980 [Spirillospora sp. NPDC048911]|uniref:hypothetical protein n=1 Tax=Spirillospora sp. NPDC048911 TaxID=3364527 RepID=UPI0037181F73
MLGARGLWATEGSVAELAVRNPVASGLTEVVHCDAGRYLTSWNYELGRVGEEGGAADRLAFLLGVPARNAS